MRHYGTYFASALLLLACAHAEDTGMDEIEDMSGGSAGNGGAAGKGGKGAGGYAGVVSSSGGTASGGSAGKGSAGAAGVAGSSSGGTGGSGGSAGTSNPAGGTAGTTGGTAGTTGGTGGISGGSGGVAGECSDPAMGGGPGSTGFTVRYKVENAGTPGTAIGAEFRIVNAGSDTVQLSELKLHYYITNEVMATISNNVNWSFIEPNGGGGQNPLSGITLNVVRMCTPTATANAYIEISFGSGSLTPGNNAHFSWTVQNGASLNWNQSNDYSFDASKTSIADWDHMVLRRNGAVIYGVDPT